ncbi:uncharacterized protein [Linepithema humile]|uniref:uncharacterized protein isoform X3 n=1 Tax=Linepithema humile TaxID=83485 RepID=UPI00351F2033
MRIEIRNRYHNYLEKKFLKVPRTSQYRRNIECESSDESSDNSVEDAQWREYCNRQSSSDSDNTDSDNTSQHNSICLSFSNEALLANIRNNEQLTISSDLSLHLVQDQHMELVQHNYHESLSTHEDPFIEQNNDQQSLSALEQMVDVSQISINDTNCMAYQILRMKIFVIHGITMHMKNYFNVAMKMIAITKIFTKKSTLKISIVKILVLVD